MGPTIEGIGWYPKVDNTLNYNPSETGSTNGPKSNVWVCGDATGLFRGIVPAMISGFYVGSLVANLISK